MSEQKPAERASAPVAKPAPPKPVVPDAPAGVGEATDPAVQHLLARREIAVRNRLDLEAPEAPVKAADEAIAEIDKELAELGYK